MRPALAVLLLVPALALAADKSDKAKSRPMAPGVDWSAMTVRATGRAAPALNAPSVPAARIGAERAAEMDALRNILATLQAVRLSSEKTVGEAMSGSDSIKAKVEGSARAFKRVDTRYFSDGGVEIDVQMSLEGLLAELLPLPPVPPVLAPPAAGTAHTGLVVDAKGLAIKPALAPRLLDQSGKEVYAAALVSPEALKRNGIAGYLASVEEASKSARVGARPLVLKALQISGASDLVLADADADKLRGPEGSASYLGEGRVIIVAE